MKYFWKLMKYLMYAFTIIAGTRTVYLIVDGNRPGDVLFWGFLATMFFFIGKCWEEEYDW